MAPAFGSSGPSGPTYLYSKSECGSSTEGPDESSIYHGPWEFSYGPSEGYSEVPPQTPFDSIPPRGVPGQLPRTRGPYTSPRTAYSRQTSRFYSNGEAPFPASVYYPSPTGPWEFANSTFRKSVSMATPFGRQSSSSVLGYPSGDASTAFLPPVLGLPRLAYESEVALIHFVVYLICAVGCVCVYYNLVVLEAYVLALFWAVVFSIPLRTAMNVLKRLILLSAEQSIDSVAAAQLSAASAGAEPNQPGASSSLPTVTAKSIFRRSPPRLASSASSALTAECHTGTPPPEGSGGFVAPEVYRHRSTSESIATRIASRLLSSVAPTAAAAESLLAQENVMIAEKQGNISGILQEVLEESGEGAQSSAASGLEAADLSGTASSSKHVRCHALDAPARDEARIPQLGGETDALSSGHAETSVKPRGASSVPPNLLPLSEQGGADAGAFVEFGAGLEGKPKEREGTRTGRKSDGKGPGGIKKSLREDRLRLSAAALAAARRPRDVHAHRRNLDLDRRLRAGAGGVRTPSGRHPAGKRARVRTGLSPSRKLDFTTSRCSLRTRRSVRSSAENYAETDVSDIYAHANSFLDPGASSGTGSFVTQPSWSLLGDVVLSSSLVRLPARFLLFMLEPLLSLVSPSPPGGGNSDRHASRPWFALLYRSCLLLLVYRLVASCTRYSVSTVLLSAAGVGLVSLLVRFALIVAGKEEAAKRSLKWLSPPSMLTPVWRLLGWLYGSMQSSLNPLLAIIVMLTSVFIVSLVVAFFCFQFYNELTLLWDAFQRTIDTYILRSSTMQQALDTIHSFAGGPELSESPEKPPSAPSNTTAPGSLSASQILFNLIAKAAEAASASGADSSRDSSAERGPDSLDASVVSASGVPSNAAGAMGSLGATIAAAVAAGAGRVGRENSRKRDSSAASHLKQLLGNSIGRYSDLWLSIRHFAASASGSPAVAQVTVAAPRSAGGPALGFRTSNPGGVQWKEREEDIPVVIVRKEPGAEPQLAGPETVFSPGSAEPSRGAPAGPGGAATSCERRMQVARRGATATTQSPTETHFGSRDRTSVVWPFSWFFRWKEAGERSGQGAVIRAGLFHFFDDGEGAETLQRVSREGPNGHSDGARENVTAPGFCLTDEDASLVFPQNAFGDRASCVREKAKEVDLFDSVRLSREDEESACSGNGTARTALPSERDSGRGSTVVGTLDGAALGEGFALPGSGLRELAGSPELSTPPTRGARELREWFSGGTPRSADGGPTPDVTHWQDAAGDPGDQASDSALHGEVWKRWVNTAELIGQLRRGNLSGAAGKAKEAWSEIYSLTSEGWWSYVTTYANTLFSGLLNSGFGAARVFFFVCFLVFKFFLSAFDMLLQAVVFFSALYYLLCSSRSCLEYLEELLCIVDPSCIVSHSINRGLRAILYSSFKRFWFYSLFTWFVYESAGMPVVYVPTAVSGLLALLPLLPPESISVIPCLVLWWGGAGEEASATHAGGADSPGAQGPQPRGEAGAETASVASETVAGAWWAVLNVVAGSQRKLGAITLLAANAVVWWNVTTAIYREIPDSNPWLVGLSVALGLSTFGMKGIIIGPVLATIPLIALTAAAKFSERRTREHQLAAMVAQQTTASPRPGRPAFRAAGAEATRRHAAKRRLPKARPGFVSASKASACAVPIWQDSRQDGPLWSSRGTNWTEPESLQGNECKSRSERGLRTSSFSSWEEETADAVAGIREVISGPPASPAAAAAAAELANAAHAAATAEVAAPIEEAGGAPTAAPEAHRLAQRPVTSGSSQQPDYKTSPPPAGDVEGACSGSARSGSLMAPQRVFSGGLSARGFFGNVGSTTAAEADFPVSPEDAAAAAPGNPVGGALPGEEVTKEASSRRGSVGAPSDSSSEGHKEAGWENFAGEGGAFFLPDDVCAVPRVRASLACYPAMRSGTRLFAGKLHCFGDSRHPKLGTLWHHRRQSKRSRAVSGNVAWRVVPHHLGVFAGRVSAAQMARRRHVPFGRDLARCRSCGEARWGGESEANALSVSGLSLPARFVECGSREGDVEGLHTPLGGLPGRAAGPLPPLYQRMMAASAPWSADVRAASCGGDLAHRSSLTCSNRSAPHLTGVLAAVSTDELETSQADAADRRSVSKPEQSSGDTEEKARSSSMLAAAVLKTAQKLEWLLDRSSGAAGAGAAPAETGVAEEAGGETAPGRGSEETGKRPLQSHGTFESSSRSQPFRSESIRHPPLVPVAKDSRGSAAAVADAIGGLGDRRGGRSVRGLGKTSDKAGKSAGSRASSSPGDQATNADAAKVGSSRAGRVQEAASEEAPRSTPDRQKEKKTGETGGSK
ncbi:hypothetical protein TGME49_216070 [Toxoplasma gondii ME49]|uniref:Transmembrane protein n=7 Tax=Toxoplasma gondii TaxID=5811 RepID=A0A125YIN3_TOXGV|nr:hypothetical protein TGME49_216070 [Toxoplasma gondii ME49]EPR58661.1 hypothetical protein TGGT1_216070 [Toxoplasma gondii GT1]ESS28740.1 putative transmembrane protein [Toxoplasma gondii VEG]KAF4639877.1 hypothetical protein TGRH88_056490 [Toxoplasma gondii]KFG30256.1 putative transmembrane protein [Toxoplasma gondii GAB2-2007-GAL-DOM2]KFG40854.1 putative transmembrane protein [Toxoplasma gondii FOU]PUA84384.1 putative transmembrane protein [Toxoplasma gondii TgCATBr9]|eukprot:XP_018635226.1 hypothetical protein TGME49_216070 [Toxoplasma gondii ME49]